MRVLVAVASRHGATREIAEAIGRTLRERGLDAQVRDVEEAGDPAEWDAVVLGSAVYAGHWLGPAQKLTEDQGEALRARPVWLFSSGPIGDPPRPEGEAAVASAALVEATGAREHRIFAGRLDKSLLSFGERAIVLAFRAAEGDFRDWAAIEAWAGEVADALGV
jgi:menaquinone-dependent protoporphyrinogen oxidase